MKDSPPHLIGVLGGGALQEQYLKYGDIRLRFHRFNHQHVSSKTVNAGSFLDARYFLPDVGLVAFLNYLLHPWYLDRAAPEKVEVQL